MTVINRILPGLCTWDEKTNWFMAIVGDQCGAKATHRHSANIPHDPDPTIETTFNTGYTCEKHFPEFFAIMLVDNPLLRVDVTTEELK